MTAEGMLHLASSESFFQTVTLKFQVKMQTDIFQPCIQWIVIQNPESPAHKSKSIYANSHINHLHILISGFAFRQV